MDRPAAEDKMAVLETSELPGRASRMDWAFFLGSSAGTLDALRCPEAAREVMAGRDRVEMDGRRRAAPAPIAMSVAQLPRDTSSSSSNRVLLTESGSSQAGRHCDVQCGWWCRGMKLENETLSWPRL